MKTRSKIKTPDVEYMDNLTCAEEFRELATIIRKSIEWLREDNLTHNQEAVLHNLDMVAAQIDATADVVEDIGMRDVDD